jgi:hypothetical protein
LPSDQPSISERATNALRDAFVAAGLKPHHAGHLAEGLVDVLSSLTPLGIPLAIDDMQRSARRGDWLGTIAAAATLVPGGRLAKFAIKGPLRTLTDAALRAHARRTFEAAYPHLKGKVHVHHAIPLKVLGEYLGRFTESEVNALKHLRGIPNAKNPKLHLRDIHRDGTSSTRIIPAHRGEASLKWSKILMKSSAMNSCQHTEAKQ